MQERLRGHPADIPVSFPAAVGLLGQLAVLSRAGGHLHQLCSILDFLILVKRRVGCTTPAAGAAPGSSLNYFIRKLLTVTFAYKRLSFPASVKIIVSRALSCPRRRAGWLSEADALSRSTKQSVNLCFVLQGKTTCKVAHRATSECDVAQ